MFRTSVAERLGSIADAGGVNSFNNFARSWQRAAGFLEVAPIRRSFAIVSDGDAQSEYGPSDVEHAIRNRASMLRAAMENERRKGSHAVFDDEDGDHDSEDDDASTVHGTAERVRQPSIRPSIREESIFQIEPQLASPLGGSYGAAYGSLSSRVNESSIRHAGRLFIQQQAAGITESDKEREPLLVKQVEPEDGKFVNIIVGQSTLPQTIFNSTNVLIGVGILALPLGIRYAGWISGMLFLFLAAVVTSYTAKLLAKCMDVDNSLITFADLAYVSYGKNARVATSILFTLELLAANVALVVLFADSLDLLVPGFGVLGWKVLCGMLLIPLNFLPLRFLSLTSILGIFSCVSSTLHSHSLGPV